MSPLQNNIQLFSGGFKKIFSVVARVDRLHIPIVGDLVVDVELEVGGRDGALAGAGHHLALVELGLAAGGQPGLQVIFHLRLVVTAIVQTSVLLPREERV